MNILFYESDAKFKVTPRYHNADLTIGTTSAHVRLDYSEATDEFEVKVYAQKTDANTICESARADVNTLPGTVTLSEANGSGVSGTIDVDGVN